METQEHNTVTNAGPRGNHICSKCGRPYPNLHPRARHRRAHRKVCGTVEGYKLDNTRDEKSRLDGDVEQWVSHNNENQAANEKAVERNISRRSNSGVGSISIKSTKSEDDVYTDAVTDFVHGSGLDASDGVVGHQKSMQKITLDPYCTNVAIEDAITDNSFAPVGHGEKNQLQTVEKLETENDKAEGALPSLDGTSCSTNVSISVYATVTIENESAVEHIVQGSRTSSEINLNLDVGEGEETSCKDLSVVAENISDGVSPLRDVSEQLMDSVSGDRIVKSREMQTDAFKGNVEYSCEVDSDVNDSAQVADSVNGNIGKYTCMTEEPDSKVSIEDTRVVAIPHAEPLEEHPEIAVDDLDHKEEKFTMPMAPNSTLAFEHITNRKDLGLEVSCYSTERAKTSESGGISSQGDVVHGAHSTENVEQRLCEVNQNIIGDTNQLSDPIAGDIQACDTEVASACFAKVPWDLIESGILPRLPTTSLLRFKSLCQSWKNVIVSDQFARTQYSTSSGQNWDQLMVVSHPLTVQMSHINYPEMNAIRMQKNSPGFLVGFCMGWTCLVDHDETEATVINPAFEPYIIPIPPALECEKLSYGFAYDHIRNTFKIVRLGIMCGDCCIVRVCEVGVDHSWPITTTEDTNITILEHPGGYEISGTLINNSRTLVWKLHPLLNQKSDPTMCVLRCLDITNNKWYVISNPFDNRTVLEIASLDQNLCLTVYESVDDANAIEVWVRFTKIGEADTWAKWFCLNSSFLNFYANPKKKSPLPIATNQDSSNILLWVPLFPPRLFWFNVRDKSLSHATFGGLEVHQMDEICSGIKSLLSLVR